MDMPHMDRIMDMGMDMGMDMDMQRSLLDCSRGLGLCTIVSQSIGSQASGFDEVVARHEHDDRLRAVNPVGHCGVDVPLHHRGVKPSRHSKAAQLGVHGLHAQVVGSADRVDAPIVREEAIKLDHVLVQNVAHGAVCGNPIVAGQCERVETDRGVREGLGDNLIEGDVARAAARAKAADTDAQDDDEPAETGVTESVQLGALAPTQLKREDERRHKH
mmetsp:Transcript_34794/g.96073  ORF Transcript_34794/g.96073 Transcript_34794/m.96073 type:complete len:217 (+) Transcript_34794:740-1390(+)